MGMCLRISVDITGTRRKWKRSEHEGANEMWEKMKTEKEVEKNEKDGKMIKMEK